MSTRTLAGMIGVLAVASVSIPTAAQTAPTTRPAGEVLTGMLREPARGAGERSVAAPVSPHGADATSGPGAVAPGVPPQGVLREGTYVVDRVGRLVRTADGQAWEFAFEADGRTAQDPPLLVLPNLKLMGMESALAGSTRDLRFRITGMVTEYRGRNHVLLEKAVVVPGTGQF